MTSHSPPEPYRASDGAAPDPSFGIEATNDHVRERPALSQPSSGSIASGAPQRDRTPTGADAESALTPLTLALLDGPPPGPELEALIEALLLVAPQPATVDELARGAGVDPGLIDAALAAIESTAGRGWVVQRHRDTVQLATSPRFAGYVRRFLNLDRETRLSSAALETLAIVAYQQPVTRSQIEAVRGVDCAGVLSTLHGRGLVEQTGRLPAVGNPIQYGTTPDFLRHFGLRSLADLPPLGDIEGRDAGLLLDATVAAADLDDTVSPPTGTAAGSLA